MGRNFLSNPIMHHFHDFENHFENGLQQWLPWDPYSKPPNLHHARSVYWRSSSFARSLQLGLSWKFETIWRAQDAPISSSTPGSIYRFSREFLQNLLANHWAWMVEMRAWHLAFFEEKAFISTLTVQLKIWMIVEDDSLLHLRACA